MTMLDRIDEIIFVVTEETEGGYSARALGVCAFSERPVSPSRKAYEALWPPCHDFSNL